MNEQHKLLAIDGGGIRGVLALEVLAELERQLAAAHHQPVEEFRLSEFFDYVSGTSTGAVIAACVARGMRVSEIMKFYEETGTKLFDNRVHRKLWSWLRYQSKYDATPLARALQDMFGKTRTLEPGNLKCLFMAVTKNQTTDSAWPISSNPHAKYNDQSLPDCNLKITLWQIVRASTAAPTTYKGERIEWDENDPSKHFLFVDGGVTPYNNPAWLLFRMATEAGYNLSWPTGEDKLLLISVGTGTSAKGDDNVLRKATGLGRIWQSRKIPGALIQSMMVDQDTNCRQVGRCVYGARLDSEIGDMIPRDRDGNKIPLSTDLGRKFLYARFNAHLEQDALDAMGLADVNAEHVQDLGSTRYTDELHQVGKRVAEDLDIQVFAPFLPAAAERFVVFSGHRIDTAERTAARFPQSAEALARQLIGDALTAELDRYPGMSLRCIASGANGGDILFLEQCVEWGIPAEIFLATEAEAFIAASVADGGADWVTRFRRLADALPVHVLPADPAAGTDIWQRTNRWMLETALARSGDKTTVIGLWDGAAGDGAGGTRQMAREAAASAAQFVHLDARQLQPGRH